MMNWSNPVRAASAQNWLGVAPAEVKRRHVLSPFTGGASSTLTGAAQ
jgi:hypothetical protein